VRLADRRTAERLISEGLARFESIDMFVKKIGVFGAKPARNCVAAAHAYAASESGRNALSQI
jgi:hypothetical protein